MNQTLEPQSNGFACKLMYPWPSFLDGDLESYRSASIPGFKHDLHFCNNEVPETV